MSGWSGTTADSPFQVSPEIFAWVQVQSLTGPLKDIHDVLDCLGCVLECPVGMWNCGPVWGLWSRFLLRIIYHLCIFDIFSFSSTLNSSTVSVATKTPILKTRNLFLKSPLAVFHVSYTEEKLLSGHFARELRSVKCCSDFHIWSVNPTRVIVMSSWLSSYQSSSPRICSVWLGYQL